MGQKWVTLVNGKMDQNLRSPDCLILTHTQDLDVRKAVSDPGREHVPEAAEDLVVNVDPVLMRLQPCFSAQLNEESGLGVAVAAVQGDRLLRRGRVKLCGPAEGDLLHIAVDRGHLGRVRHGARDELRHLARRPRPRRGRHAARKRPRKSLQLTQ